MNGGAVPEANCRNLLPQNGICPSAPCMGTYGQMAGFFLSTVPLKLLWTRACPKQRNIPK
nr:hypothetical protein [Bacillaceae bacterium]